ncbi:MAG: MoaD/ThiS family protein [Candidatus Altiarchaeota archaeon]|nr:MoaD/ThiS family protein [Candidatus Altiarchaeota archaeon]
MKIKVEMKDKLQNVELAGKTVKDLMTQMHLILDEYVPILNGSVVTELENLSEGDSVKFIRVWSGG